MLAQSFKTADQLGITEPQRAALAKTLVLLETGKLEHIQPSDLIFEISQQQKPVFSGHFNMARWTDPDECGTVACIGGTAEMVGELEPKSLGTAAGKNTPLYNLFFPVQYHFPDITPAQAATALRSYLTCGEARWEEALA